MGKVSSLVGALGGDPSDPEEGWTFSAGAVTAQVASAPAPMFVEFSDAEEERVLSEAEQRFVVKLADGIAIEYSENSVEWARRGVTRAHVDFFLAALMRVTKE